MDEQLESFGFQNYQILSLIGEGSFGKVFKAVEKKADKKNQNVVALKILLKRGRSTKELAALKQEANIQQNLRHPNIIQLHTSFETEKELVFVCEFAVSDLHKLLAKVGSLGEQRTQKLSYDLISALFYLHSHRILHRDLKPPNILLDKNYKAKVCDFGLARNMTIGTQILTSIKGTPLYMAPELLEGRGYGHEADLWSLGCIIYEMLAGESPFNTRSILHLMQLIRYGNVKWPSFLSSNCINFLKGLLVNNPAKRMTWSEILEHKFVKGNIIILNDKSISDSPFTRPRVIQEELVAKKVTPVQKIDSNVEDLMSSRDSVKVNLNLETDIEETDNEEIFTFKNESSDELKAEKIEHLVPDLQNLPQNFQFHNHLHQLKKFEAAKIQNAVPIAENSNMVMHRFLDNVDPEIQQFLMSPPMMMTPMAAAQTIIPKSSEKSQVLPTKSESQRVQSHANSTDVSSVPLETEEWLQFIFKSMQEILDGDLEIYKQDNMMTMIIGLLREPKFNSKMIHHVVQIICLPYAIDMPKTMIQEIDKMYARLKLVPNLVYASKLLAQRKFNNQQTPFDITKPKSETSPPTFNQQELKTLSGLYDLVVHLIYSSETFLHMLCDAMVILNVNSLFRSFILSSSSDDENSDAIRLTNAVLAIICLILQDFPENAKLVEQIIFHDEINFEDLLRHKNAKIRSRTCVMLRLLGRFCCYALQSRWNANLSAVIEREVGSAEEEEVRKEAMSLIEEFKNFAWFKKNFIL